jgi:hypothetical protein
MVNLFLMVNDWALIEMKSKIFPFYYKDRKNKYLKILFYTLIDAIKYSIDK